VASEIVLQEVVCGGFEKVSEQSCGCMQMCVVT
jgi:hypothetical protein